MYLWDIENNYTYNNRMGFYKTKTEYEFIEESLNFPMRILDIGGGSGRFAIPLKNKGHQITVLDLSEHAVEILNERDSTIECIQSDFMHWEPNIQNTFDMALAIEVLLYVKDWNAFFNKVNSLLKKNGIFIFTATNKNSWRTILQEVKNRKKPNYNYSIFSYNRYKKIIHETNFSIERVSGFLWVPCKYNSNAKIVEYFSWIEKHFSLSKFIAQSPWLMFAVKKL